MAHHDVHVVITCWNVRASIDATVHSLLEQTRQDFSVVFVDDASSDGTAERLTTLARNDPRFELHLLEQRVWAARAREIALDRLDARPGDVVVLVDGDDQLLGRRALETIHAIHRGRGLLAAHGNHVTSRGTPCTWSRDYPLAAKITGDYRSVGWLAAHPRSFRYGLWRHVRREALRDATGNPFRFASDMALFLPLLELAGLRTGHWPEPLYVYNRETPYHDDKLDPAAQRAAALEVLRQPPHAPLPRELQAELLAL